MIRPDEIKIQAEMTVGNNFKRNSKVTTRRDATQKISIQYNYLRKQNKLKNFPFAKIRNPNLKMSGPFIQKENEFETHKSKFQKYQQGLSSRISSGSNQLTSSDRKSGLPSNHRTDSSLNFRNDSGSHPRFGVFIFQFRILYFKIFY